jgi:hypothetical protein
MAYGEKGGATLRLTEGPPDLARASTGHGWQNDCRRLRQVGRVRRGEAREKALQMSAMPDIHVAPTTAIHWTKNCDETAST